MKVTDLKKLIEETISKEVRNKILSENEGNKKEFYHIKCEGVPLATFESEKAAEDALPDYKAKHKGELIIEKGEYESHGDMMDKLDEMNDQLEEDNEMQPEEGNAFSGALAKAKEDGDDEFNVDGKEYDVDECEECGMHSNNEHDSNLGEHQMCECGGQIMEDGCCSECGMSMEEHAQDGDPENVCPKCGKQVCECGQNGGDYMGTGYDSSEDMAVDMVKKGIHESKKKTIRLTESEFKRLINKMVSESVPGLRAAEKSRTASGKENKSALADTEKKISKALSFDGNDNPEFPKAIGKGEKVARENTKDQDAEVAKNFAGLQNLEYAIEPSEAFKKRLKMAIEGDRLMGNAPTTEKTNIVASNGAKAEQPESKEGNTIKTPETAKKIEKQVKDRAKDKKERVLYKKEVVPTKKGNINENVLASEIAKMKNMLSYNKKTQ